MKKRKRIETQNLARHCNEDLILAILSGGTRHGYQLALELEERSGSFFRLNHGTLYPILHKLEKEGMIRGSWSDEGPKRRRRQYSLTLKGKKHASHQIEAWREFYGHFFAIMKEVEG
jgi:DNA-binding PadR family transcriptional regulator